MARADSRRSGSVCAWLEAYACLVAAPVFNTGEVEHLGLASSIPVRLRRRPPPIVDLDHRIAM